MGKERIAEQLLDTLCRQRDEIGSVPLSALQALLSDIVSELSREELSHYVTAVDFESGSYIFHEGEQGDALYLIENGELIVIKGALPKPSVIAFRQNGEFVGEMALLDGGLRSASVVASKPTRLLRIEQGCFWNLMHQRPTMVEYLLKLMTQKLRDSDNQRSLGYQENQVLESEVSRLVQQQRHLLELDMARREATEHIVHDLRNPLLIIGQALKDLQQVKQHEDLFVDLASVAYERMKNLVDVLLESTRLESGERTLSIQPLSIEVLIDKIIERLRPLLDVQNIQFQSLRPDHVPLVLADAVQTERIIMNLLDNAIKYTTEYGEIALDLELLVGYVVVKVKDAGRGIPKADRVKIFNRHIQLGEKQKYHGYGLGLRFCKLAVEAQEGRIWIEDGLSNRGSSFCFTLPICAVGRDRY